MSAERSGEKIKLPGASLAPGGEDSFRGGDGFGEGAEELHTAAPSRLGGHKEEEYKMGKEGPVRLAKVCTHPMRPWDDGMRMRPYERRIGRTVVGEEKAKEG